MVQQTVEFWESLGKMDESCLVGQPFYTSCGDCIPGSFPVRLPSSIGQNEFILPMFKMSIEDQIKLCKEMKEIARQRQLRTEKLAEQKKQKLLASQTENSCPASQTETEQVGELNDESDQLVKEKATLANQIKQFDNEKKEFANEKAAFAKEKNELVRQIAELTNQKEELLCRFKALSETLPSEPETVTAKPVKPKKSNRSRKSSKRKNLKNSF